MRIPLRMPRPDLALPGRSGTFGLSPRPFAVGGHPLSPGVRLKMEAAFGADFARVRVHEGPEPESIGAAAFTRGQDIHFARGRYRPRTAEGQRLLGHELAHVVQQRVGRVAALRASAVPLNLDPSLEAEAARSGAQAALGRPAYVAGGSGAAPCASCVGPPPIQAQFLEGLRRNWLPTWLGGYTASQVRQKEAHEATVRRLQASRRAARRDERAKTGPERLEEIRSELSGHRASLSPRDHLLLKTLNEVTPHSRSPQVQIQDVSGLAREGQTTRLAAGRGHYRIELQPENELGDRDRYLSNLFHELHHVNVDQTYGVNRQTGRVFINVPQAANQEQAAQQFDIANSDRAEDLIDSLPRDPHLDDVTRPYIQKQLTYLSQKPRDETDTVVSEMLLYFKLKGISEHSPTSRELEKWARERFHARREQRAPKRKKR